MSKKIILSVALALIFFILSFLILTSNIIFITHLFDKKHFIKDFNIQGIECIDNKVFFLENNADVYEYYGNKSKKIFSLLRYDEDAYNNINIVSHPTSFAFFNNDSTYVGNAMPKQSVSILKFDFAKLIQTKYLSSDAVLDIKIPEIYNTKYDNRGVHLEAYRNGDEDLLMVGANLADNQATIDFYDQNFNKKKCSIPYHDHIQNIYFNYSEEKIYISSNLYGFGGAEVEIYDIKSNDVCPNVQYDKKIIPLTVMELEGYTYCQSKEFYAYAINDDSYIIMR